MAAEALLAEPEANRGEAVLEGSMSAAAKDEDAWCKDDEMQGAASGVRRDSWNSAAQSSVHRDAGRVGAVAQVWRS